jgi:hypothetical protein
MTLVGLVVLSLQASGDAPGRWEGFAPGSWVVMSARSVKGQAVYRPSRDEIAGVDPDGRSCLSTDGGAPSPVPRPVAFASGLEVVSRSRETVTIGARRLPCTVVTYAAGGASVTAWFAEGVAVPCREMTALPNRVAVPRDVVRVQGRYTRPSSTLTTTLEVVELSSQIEVAGRMVDCVVETSSMVHVVEDGKGCLRSWKRWLSDAVPGRIVRQDRQCTGDPAAIAGAYTMRDEVLDFHLAP